MASAQNLAAMRQERFKKTDQDGDGKITKDELGSAIPKNGKGTGVDEVFAKVDTDQDGAISEEEDAAAFEQMRQSGSPKGRPPGPPPSAADMASALFKSADADEDDALTLEELTQALSEEDEDLDAEAIFKAADEDEDGSISKAELESTLQKAMEQRGGSRPPPPSGYDESGNATPSGTASSRFSVLA